jgi:hypothetical protein
MTRALSLFATCAGKFLCFIGLHRWSPSYLTNNRRFPVAMYCERKGCHEAVVYEDIYS